MDWTVKVLSVQFMRVNSPACCGAGAQPARRHRATARVGRIFMAKGLLKDTLFRRDKQMVSKTHTGLFDIVISQNITNFAALLG